MCVLPTDGRSDHAAQVPLSGLQGIYTDQLLGVPTDDASDVACWFTTSASTPARLPSQTSMWVGFDIANVLVERSVDTCAG